MTGVFATVAVGGAAGWIEVGFVQGVWDEGPGVMIEQLIAVLATLAYSGIATFIILKVLDVIPGLGLQEAEDIEATGLDANVHGERGYIADGAD